MPWMQVLKCESWAGLQDKTRPVQVLKEQKFSGSSFLDLRALPLACLSPPTNPPTLIHILCPTHPIPSHTYIHTHWALCWCVAPAGLLLTGLQTQVAVPSSPHDSHLYCVTIPSSASMRTHVWFSPDAAIILVSMAMDGWNDPTRILWDRGNYVRDLALWSTGSTEPATSHVSSVFILFPYDGRENCMLRSGTVLFKSTPGISLFKVQSLKKNDTLTGKSWRSFWSSRILGFSILPQPRAPPQFCWWLENDSNNMRADQTSIYY